MANGFIDVDKGAAPSPNVRRRPARAPGRALEPLEVDGGGSPGSARLFSGRRQQHLSQGRYPAIHLTPCEASLSARVPGYLTILVVAGRPAQRRVGPMQSLSGRTALVTGAAGGVGRGIVRAPLGAGAHWRGADVGAGAP